MASQALQDTLQDYLDDIASKHTSTNRKGRALSSLEKLLAEICVPTHQEARLKFRYFVALQDTFQCNVSSRVLAWIGNSTTVLDGLTEDRETTVEKESEATTLSLQLVQALSLLQGIALIHPASKQYLGRRFSLEVLLDLLLVSRHVSPLQQPSKGDSSTSSRSQPTPVSLASTVIDTLLCVLVDSSESLRAFEDTNGVQYVVKILKRAGTPREVRMKCLEFLYFYLLDETGTRETSLDLSALEQASLVPTAPNSPVKSTMRSASELSSSSVSSGSSTSSVASSSTYATSFSSSSFDGASTPLESSPPSKSTLAPAPIISGIKPSNRIFTPPQSRSLLMLRKDVDYTPMSPKKASVANLGVAGNRVPSSLSRSSSEKDQPDFMRSPTKPSGRENQTPSRVPQTPIKASQRSLPTPSHSRLMSSDLKGGAGPSTPVFQRGHRRARTSLDLAPINSNIPFPMQHTAPVSRPPGTRTMEEKKEILGSMLGNVDALVEGVRKAGIWGLA